MSKKPYSVSINPELIKPKYDSYKIINPIALNVFLTKYRLGENYNTYRDKNKSNNIYVALKRFKVELLKDSEISLMVYEINLLRSLKHKNILPLITNFVNKNEVWMITPLAEYGSCYQWSRPFGMPELSIALIIRDVLKAVEYLHGQGIIHRGIRSSRILISSNGTCLLTGLRHSISCIKNCKFKRVLHDYPPAPKNNVNWYSPELLEQNLYGYSFKTDVHSIGITCCELANGSVPFAACTPTQILLDKLTNNLPYPLDKDSCPIRSFELDDYSHLDRSRFVAYKNRKFSLPFHQFVNACCFPSDLKKRSSIKDLLEHEFLKQIKKNSNLLNLLPKKMSYLDNTEEEACSSQSGLMIEYCNLKCMECEDCRFSGYIDETYFRKSKGSEPEEWIL